MSLNTELWVAKCEGDGLENRKARKGGGGTTFAEPSIHWTHLHREKPSFILTIKLIIHIGPGSNGCVCLLDSPLAGLCIRETFSISESEVLYSKSENT